MKKLQTYFLRSFTLGIVLALSSCDEEKQTPDDFFDTDGFKIELAADRALGHGQYVTKKESGSEFSVKVDVVSPTSVKDLKITKTLNLQPDKSFGTNGELIVPVNGSTFSYDFKYKALSSDVDQLVGFSFEASNSSGAKEVSDLNVQVTLSPKDNIPRRKWNLVSILHVNEKNAEVINDCEKDNSILFNADGTMQYLYGKDTGAGNCGFDGFNIYDKWVLSDDLKTLSIIYHGLFNPAVTTDVYKVRSLTTEEMKLELTVDLTALGLGVETFLYVYKAGPK